MAKQNKDLVIQVRVSASQKRWFESVAARKGLRACQWLRMHGIEAARTAAPDDEPQENPDSGEAL